MRRIVCLVLVLAACRETAGGPPLEPPPSATTFVPVPGEPTTIPEVPEPAPSCTVEPAVRLAPRGDGGWDAVAVLSNLAPAPVAVDLATRCAGPATLTGLPDGYDAADLCARGPCPPGSPTTTHVTIPASGEAELGRFVLGPASACHGPLPPGRYALGVEVHATGGVLCPSRAAVLEVRAARPAPPPPPAPAPAPCPAMGCAYVPCPPGVEPPTGCAAVCGCAGMHLDPLGAPRGR